MRFNLSSSSSSSLQCLCLAAADAASMYSSRAPYRGGRNQWRRGFSDRPSGGRDSFVSGDAHFQSVSDSNYEYRQVEGGGNRGGFQRQPPPPPPYGRSPPQFRWPPPPPHFREPPLPPYGQPPHNYSQVPPPHFHQQPPRYGQPPPQFGQPMQPFRQPQTFNQPRARPPDFRHWQYALSQPPSHCERFVILSYNILADYLAINHRSELYYHIPRYILDWGYRRRRILVELGLWSADIMCLQEVDRFQDLEEELKLHGYSGIWKRRTGIPTDGCAIFWRMTRFKLLHEEFIEFNKLGLRDNVAQICVLEHLTSPNPVYDGSAAFLPSSNGVNRVVICNIHVLYNPKRGEMKLGQVRMLLDRAHAVSKLWNDAPVVICGDFNCTPKSPLYNFISEQKLDLTGIPRDEISGQSSAELLRPRQYTPNPGQSSLRSQTADNAGGDSVLVNDEVGAKQSNNMADDHKLAHSIMKCAPSVNALTELEGASTVLDGLDESCSGVDNRKSNGVSDSSVEETQEGMVERCGNDTSSSGCVPHELPNEVPISHHKIGSHPAVMENSGVQDLTPSLLSCEDVISVVIDPRHENLSGSADQCDETLTKNSLSEGERVCDDKEKGSLYVGERASPSEGEVYSSITSGLDKKHENPLFSDEASNLIPNTNSPDDNEESLPRCLKTLSLEGIADDVKVSTSKSVQDGHQVNTSDALTSADLDVDHEVVEFNKSNEDKEEIGSSNQDERNDLSPTVNRIEEVVQFCLDLNRESLRAESEKEDQNSKECVTGPNDSQMSPPFDEVQNDSSPCTDSELADLEKNTFSLSSWTPMEIHTASGNAESTLLEHPLKLRSTYTEVEDYSGTKGPSKEPEVTSYHRRFMGTVDYIWCSEGLQTVKVLDTIPKHALQWTPGFPTRKWGSDHIALASQLAFTKDNEKS